MNYFDIHGNPMTLTEWARTFENRRDGDSDWNKRHLVTETKTAKVSTVWLGLDHNYSDQGPPLIFETMVFGGTLDGEQDRYVTLEQAHAGHEMWVEKCKKEEV